MSEEVVEDQPIDLLAYEGEWFAVQTLSGQEMKVCASISKRLIQEELENEIFSAMVPMERVTEVKMGRKVTVNRKFFPGYILLNAHLYGENRQINERVWTFINESNGIIGFMGDRPAALMEEEVRDIQDQLNRGKQSRPRIEFELGEMVNIRTGPFEGLEGKIESIDPDRGRLKLSVSIFGRSTPVEVEYSEVERG